MEHMGPLGRRIIEDFGPRFSQHVWIEPLTVLLVLGMLVAGAIIITRMLVNRSQPSAPAATKPLQILEERFARGEIDEEEFRSRRDALRSS